MARLMSRLDHAWRHREEFYALAHAYLQSQPFEIRREVDSITGHVLLRVDVTEPPPVDMAYVVGDCINDIRSTLDNLVYALPGANPDRAAFPVLPERPATPIGRMRQLTGINEQAVALLEQLQPYQQTPDATSVSIPIGTLLLQLHRLWNWDKHREPSLVAAGVRESRIVLNSRAFAATDLRIGVFESGDIVARLVPAGPAAQDPNVGIRAELGLDIVFGPDAPMGLDGQTVKEVLTDVYNCVRLDVLPRFSQFL